MNRTLAALAAAAVAVSANAVLVIDQDPGNPPGSENILFNDPSLISKGLLVQGMTNENFLFVDFFDAGEDLVTARASVMAVDGGMTQLSVAMNDPTLGISAYRFNLNALASGDVTINVFDHGVLSLAETFALKENGPNWFRVYGTEGEAVSVISFDSTVEIGAVRNNHVIAVPNPVPEPSGLVALGFGLAAIVSLRKRS